MINSKTIFGIGAGLGGVSVIIVAIAVISMMQTTDNLITSLNNLKINDDTIRSLGEAPSPTTDQQITEARQAIQTASSRIGSLKITIFNHAERAAAQHTLFEARTILLDIARNAQKVADSHQQLEARFYDLIELYNRKIEEIYQAQIVKNGTSGYGLSFWVGVIGIIGAISAMVLAWRKDHREVRELELALEKLRAERRASQVRS